MHTFRIFRESSPNIAYIKVEEGNINIETGIRMHFNFLDINKNTIEKHLFTLSGNEFINLGANSKDLRIAIIKKILECTGSILIEE